MHVVATTTYYWVANTSTGPHEDTYNRFVPCITPKFIFMDNSAMGAHG